MQWELLATWTGICLTVVTGIYKMGKQSQRIDDQDKAITALESKVDENKDIPIKLATLETDIKYMILAIADIKQILMNKGNN